MEIYTYAKCSSCRNAEAVAADHGIDATKRDIFKEPLTAAEIRGLFARIGRPVKEMVATRSRPYRDLGLDLDSLSDDQIVALMADHPALIRRPIVVAGDASLVGFNRTAMELLVADSAADYA